jgi:hypothetical protein
MDRKQEWRLIEDNGGGLYLAVFENGKCVYFSSERERDIVGLREDIQFLQNGGNTDGWEINLPDGVSPEEAYEELVSHEFGWSLIADENAVHWDRLGKSGMKVFVLKCPLCEEGEMLYAREGKTDLYLCDTCLAVLFEYKGDDSLRDVKRNLDFGVV